MNQYKEAKDQNPVKNKRFLKFKIKDRKMKILTDYRRKILTFQFQWIAALKKVIKNVLNHWEIIKVLK